MHNSIKRENAIEKSMLFPLENPGSHVIVQDQ